MNISKLLGRYITNLVVSLGKVLKVKAKQQDTYLSIDFFFRVMYTIVVAKIRSFDKLTQIKNTTLLSLSTNLESSKSHVMCAKIVINKSWKFRKWSIKALQLLYILKGPNHLGTSLKADLHQDIYSLTLYS